MPPNTLNQDEAKARKWLERSDDHFQAIAQSHY
jgi:hypothetical protein